MVDAPPAFAGVVREVLQKAGFALPDGATNALAAFLHLLLEHNRRLNLTRDDAMPTAAIRHVVEPLAAWFALRERVPAGAIVDVGSGGGAPGIPWAIVAPDRDVVLVESRARKAAYLRETADALGLARVRVEEARAEAYAHGPERGQAALAVARALAPPPLALEVLLPLVGRGGLAVVLAGPAVDAQREAVAEAAAAGGGSAPTFEAVTWAASDRDLRLVVVEKTGSSPDRLPRALRRARRERARRS